MANKSILGEAQPLKTTDQLPFYLDDVTKVMLGFHKAVFELGLKLIEEYRAGTCRDSVKTLEAIIEIFKVQPKKS